MKTFPLIGTLLASTLLAGTAAMAATTTLTIESWRNDDLTVWQQKIIPAFEKAHPDIKVVFA
ncbi:sugar ABC transporter substrate-binding protein, partial [Thioclava sp. BHET1]